MHSQFGREINSELGKIKVVELHSEEEGTYFAAANNNILDKNFSLGNDFGQELNKKRTLILPTTSIKYQKLAISDFDWKFHLVSNLPGP